MKVRVYYSAEERAKARIMASDLGLDVEVISPKEAEKRNKKEGEIIQRTPEGVVMSHDYYCNCGKFEKTYCDAMIGHCKHCGGME